MELGLQGKMAVITGGSMGIGLAIAHGLAAEGVDVALCARSGERVRAAAEEVKKAHGVRAIGVSCDVTRPGQIAAFARRVEEEFGGCDILINNAGVGAMARIEDSTQETLRRVFEVNFFALFELTQLALPHLKKGAEPMVVNLSSIVGLRGVPHYSVYGSAKFAVAGLSESMRAEFVRYGIDVLLVCPGTTQTEFFDVLCQDTSQPKLPVHRSVTSEYVAARIVRAMKQGKHKIIPYFPAVLLDKLNRLCPRFVDWIMAKYA